MDTLKIIALGIVLVNSIADVIVHKTITEKALLWLILFWVIEI